MLPDVEVIFKFNGNRKQPISNGYRPAHLVKENYLTTGVHCYYDVKDKIIPNCCVKGTISFITPEFYPHSIWIGKKIPIQEGDRVIGEAIVTKVFNSILQSNTGDDSLCGK